MSIIQKTYRSIFPDYPAELKKIAKGYKNLLDVGCGYPSPIQSFSKTMHCEGVDLFQPSINKSKKQGIHKKYHKIDVMSIEKKFKNNAFDVVLASDLIEHLTKKEGMKLLSMMEKIASKRVIIFTPTGFFPQGEYQGNKWQIHKSGWEVEEMQKMGYNVIGINGWKPLRGDSAAIRFRPKFFWLLISDITQLFTRKHPKRSFSILCWKDL